VAPSQYINFVFWENTKKFSDYKTKAEKVQVDIQDERSQHFPPK